MAALSGSSQGNLHWFSVRTGLKLAYAHLTGKLDGSWETVSAWVFNQKTLSSRRQLTFMSIQSPSISTPLCGLNMISNSLFQNLEIFWENQSGKATTPGLPQTLLASKRECLCWDRNRAYQTTPFQMEPLFRRRKTLPSTPRLKGAYC